MITRRRTPWTVALVALIISVLWGVAHGQSSAHLEALQWIQSAQQWRTTSFAPLYRELNSRGLRSAEPNDVVRGPDLVPGFLPDYRHATDGYYDVMSRFFADESPITLLMTSNDVDSKYLGSAMDAYSYNIQALHRVLESFAYGSATVQEIQYWYQIATLWGSIASLNMNLYFNSQ